MDRPPFRDGAIAVAGDRIVALGDARTLRGQYPDAVVQDCGNSILLPGLINAHTHLELSNRTCGPSPASFADWLIDLVQRGPAGTEQLAKSVSQSIDEGVGQCLRFGVSTIGDISRHCNLTRPLLRDGPLRAVSFGEVQGMGQRRSLLEERLATAVDRSCRSPWLTIGITPHAPYSIEIEGYRRCLEAARQHGMPLATHLAETPDERSFLADHSGPFREFWEMLGWWDDRVPTFKGGPIRLAQALGLLDYPTLLAHVNYCDDEEMEILAEGRASVVYCPRTHAYFSHPPHRWRQMFERGINVALGTDSCASSPDLNILEDLRLVHRLAPDAQSMNLWAMITTRGAAALGLQDRVGSLSVGKAADVVAFPAIGDEPLLAILEQPVQPSALWIAGNRCEVDQAMPGPRPQNLP